MDKKSKYSPLIILIFICLSCGNADRVLDISTPIAYSISKNLIDHGIKEVTATIDVTAKNLKSHENGWPQGQLEARVKSSLVKNKTVNLLYTFNGSHLATVAMDIEGKNPKQLNVNIYESAVVFGQASLIDQSIEKICRELSSRIDSSRTLAVLQFDGNKSLKLFSDQISESLITCLANNGKSVVERKLLDPVFSELKFQQNSLSEHGSIEARNKIGKFLGAEIVITGTISVMKEEAVLNIRAIDINSGLIVSASKEILPKYLLIK